MQSYWSSNKSSTIQELGRQATSLRTLHGEKLHRQTGNSKTSQNTSRDRRLNSGRLQASSVNNSPGSTRSSRNSSQNASMSVQVVQLGQPITIPPKQPNPTSTTPSQNGPCFCTCLNNNHVSTQCRAVTADVLGKLIGLRNRNFSH